MSNKKPTQAELDRQRYLKDNALNGFKKFISIFTFSTIHNKWMERQHQARRFDTIILPAEQKSFLLNDLGKFLSGESWYLEKNIPYRRGYFLYGPAGTGKTSIAMAIATHSHRPIYYMPADLNMDAITTIPHNAVVLLEDADKAITTKDTSVRIADPEPVSLTTAYPNINPSEHNIWLKAIKNNDQVKKDFEENYCGLEANFDTANTGGVSIMESVIEGILTDMKNGFAEPKKSQSKIAEGVEITYQPAETEAEYHARRAMYKNIIREANRLRREYYDSVRFDQERVGTLLQIIDGALTPYGAIFVMSTNKKEDIHSTMLRDGRMDVHNEITYLTEDTLNEMLEKFNVSNKQEIIDSIKSPGQANITPAQLQGGIIRAKN